MSSSQNDTRNTGSEENLAASHRHPVIYNTSFFFTRHDTIRTTIILMFYAHMYRNITIILQKTVVSSASSLLSNIDLKTRNSVMETKQKDDSRRRENPT